MKPLAAFVLALGVSLCALPTAAQEAHRAAGTVNRLDKEKGTITIAHGAVPTLKWPAMTMTFKARDKKMLEQLKPGTKVEFDFVQSGKDYVITQVK